MAQKKVAKKVTETRAEKFVRLAEKRMSRTIKSVLSVSKLSNRASYEFTEEQAAQVVQALRDAVAIVEARFAEPDTKDEGGFTFGK